MMSSPRPNPNTPPAMPPKTKPRIVAPIPVGAIGSDRRRRPRHCAATSPATLNNRMAIRASPRSNIDPELHRDSGNDGKMNGVDITGCVDQNAAIGFAGGDRQKSLMQALVERLIEPLEPVGSA